MMGYVSSVLDTIFIMTLQLKTWGKSLQTAVESQAFNSSKTLILSCEKVLLLLEGPE